ncbi:hypothetical protein FB451DRAFT_1185335 [Mycena latifolia]|nr:hypothetical protein FB451DRAFT_1185335 [Mycena latifolia]
MDRKGSSRRRVSVADLVVPFQTGQMYGRWLSLRGGLDEFRFGFREENGPRNRLTQFSERLRAPPDFKANRLPDRLGCRNPLDTVSDRSDRAFPLSVLFFSRFIAFILLHCQGVGIHRTRIQADPTTWLETKTYNVQNVRVMSQIAWPRGVTDGWGPPGDYMGKGEGDWALRKGNDSVRATVANSNPDKMDAPLAMRSKESTQRLKEKYATLQIQLAQTSDEKGNVSTSTWHVRRIPKHAQVMRTTATRNGDAGREGQWHGILAGGDRQRGNSCRGTQFDTGGNTRGWSGT